LAKRREAKRIDEEKMMDYSPRSDGRPARRRSRSTGDTGILNVPVVTKDKDELQESINRELKKYESPAKPTVSLRLLIAHCC
jgi:hypothetical protein